MADELQDGPPAGPTVPTVPAGPAAAEVERWIGSMRALTRLISPVFVGMDRVPAERPLLFVGNHTLYGLLDAPFLYQELWRRHGIFPRALGDHMHFKVPGWRELVTRWGVVDGTRDNCRTLMERRECLLVFPGGSREASKRKGEKYQLIWRERMGFVRMAVEHGCTIVPFAAIGAEDALDVVVDAEQLLRTRVGMLAQMMGLRKDLMPPLVQGLAGTPIPRPERLYFKIGEPITTADVAGRHGDDAVCEPIRDRVRDTIEQDLVELRYRRAADPKRGWLPRLLDLWGRGVSD